MSDNLRLEKCVECGINVWWSGSEPPRHTSCESAKAMTTVTYVDEPAAPSHPESDGRAG
jgi:hypothetical protein